MTETRPEAPLRTAAARRLSAQQPAVRPPGTMAPGLDPAAATGTPFEQARRLLEAADNDWVTAKERYGGSGQAPDRMWSLFHYRKVYIDAKLLQLRAVYPQLRIRSVGSANPTSDYDITVSGPGAAQAVAEFNESFRREWGKESATVFDVNLYVKDFMPERGNFAFPYAPGTPGLLWNDSELLTPVKGDARRARSWKQKEDGTWEADGGRKLSPEQPDTGIVEPRDPVARALAQVDQDIAALTKLRKYMDAAEWQAYVEQLAALVPDSARADTLRRHRAADTVHRRATAELAGRLREETAHVRPGTTDEAYIEELEHSRPDAVVRARNLIYAEHAARLSAAQKRYEKAPSDALALDIRAATSYSLWHAMEAYHSQGAVLDVVGKQAKSDVKVTGAHYLQSFNEQLGDLLKDLKHYGDAGEAFYRSAKYLQRMMAAARRALDATGASLPDEQLALLTQLEEISSADGTLLSMRGSHEWYAAASAEDKSEIATGVYGRTLGITGKDGLRSAVLELGARVNAAVRARA
ncbi:hypothetical protein ACFP1Z_19095 [Streptomyces gamaensis]|uniref:Nucleotidyltransferase n=1 Tax=Streptomyces gamaensis TaxID=1763542 RepID=A0ABW0Z6S2_9ACTN